MLLASKQLACAANFEVAHGNTETRTELAGLLQGGQALAAITGKLWLRS